MSKLPSKDYQIRASDDLDDVVIWVKLEAPPDFTRNRTVRERLSDLFSEALITKCFVGPIEAQYECDLVIDTRLELPAIYHIQLNESKQSKLFLYVTETTIELHCPEYLFVTGVLAKDAARRHVVMNWTRDIAEAFDIRWQFAEYAGNTITVTELNIFWTEYIKKLFGRVDYEEIE